MSQPPSSPARRILQVALPFVVVGLLLAGWFAFLRKPEAAPLAPGPSVAGTVESDSLAARMLGSGFMRNMLAAAQRTALEEEFNGFMTAHKFTAAQRTRLVDLLLDQQSTTVESMLTRMSAKLSPEEDAALARKMDQANAAVVAKVQAFFAQEFPGDAGRYDAFQHYAARSPDRTEVAVLQKQLVAGNHALTPAQAESLAEILHEVREGLIPAIEPEEVGTLSKAEFARRILDQQRIDRVIQTRVAPVLDAAQLEVFRQHQADRVKALQALADAAPNPPAPAK